MKRKRIGKILFSLWIVTLAFISIAGITASAGNTTLRQHTFTFPRETSSTQNSQNYVKETKSNVGVTCTKSAMSFKISAYYQVPGGKKTSTAPDVYIKQGQTLQLSWGNTIAGPNVFGGVKGRNDNAQIPYSWTATVQFQMDLH